MGKVSEDTLSDLHELDTSVALRWSVLSASRKESIWLGSIEGRFAASNNGFKETAGWIKTSRQFLSGDLSEDNLLSEAVIKIMNAGLRGLPGESHYREYVSISADLTFAPPELIRAEVAKAFAACAQIAHPLIRISFLAQELLSIHPFQDANGRTTRLLTDLLLRAAGYPPPLFSSPLDFMIARSWATPSAKTLEHSVLVIAGAIERGLSELPFTI